MKKWMHKAEKIIDEIIPAMLLVFIIMIMFEVFFPDIAAPYKNHTDLFDSALIGIFMADLFFKYQRARNFGKFLKKYWLQILAVIPFYIVFRVFEYLELAQIASTGVKLVNETTMFGRGPAMIVREAQSTEGFSRTYRLLRFKPLTRLPRLLMALPFFEKPTGKHHKKAKPKAKRKKR